MDTLDAGIEEKLKIIPVLAGLDRAELKIERLGGLTNRNYRLDYPEQSFVLRLAGVGTSEYINRLSEMKNLAIAAKAGVNAIVLYFDETDGTMLARTLEATTMSVEGFRDLGAVCRAGVVLRRLHDSGEEFVDSFELFEQIDRYLLLLKEKNAKLPEGYSEVQAQAESVREALGKHPLPAVPCHCDPLVENFLDTGTTMYLIDFEYAGNNDPMWDLGDLSVEGEFSPEQDSALLEAYFGHEPDPFDTGRMVMYKAMCDLLWTLWGVVQHVDKNPADDFWAYAQGRLERCKSLMNTKDFQKHLQAVFQGPVEP